MSSRCRQIESGKLIFTMMLIGFPRSPELLASHAVASFVISSHIPTLPFERCLSRVLIRAALVYTSVLTLIGAPPWHDGLANLLLPMRSSFFGGLVDSGLLAVAQ